MKKAELAERLARLERRVLQHTRDTTIGDALAGLRSGDLNHEQRLIRLEAFTSWARDSLYELEHHLKQLAPPEFALPPATPLSDYAAATGEAIENLEAEKGVPDLTEEDLKRDGTDRIDVSIGSWRAMMTEIRAWKSRVVDLEEALEEIVNAPWQSGGRTPLVAIARKALARD